MSNLSPNAGAAVSFDIAPFRHLYPWQGKFHQVGGHRMHYLDEGQGRPVVMLHGNPTWSFYWRHLIGPVCKTHRVIVPDHIGCGLSDKPNDDAYGYTLEERVSNIESLLESLGIVDDITLVLHDWGGMIGLAFANRNRERISRLVITNTAGFGLPEGKALPWQIALAKHFPVSEFVVRRLNAFVLGAAQTCSTRKGGLDKDVKAAYIAPYNNYENRIAIHRFVKDIPLSADHQSYGIVDDVSQNLDLLKEKPTLIFWGLKDFVFDRHFLGEWQRRWPEAQYHIYEDAGHYILEDAHERIVPILEDFLTQTEHPAGEASEERK